MGVKDVDTSALTNKSAGVALALVPRQSGNDNVTTPLGAGRGLAEIAADIRAYYAATRSGLKAEKDGRADYCSNTMKLAAAVRLGRQLHQNDNVAFGAWFANEFGDDFINKNERAALIRIAEYPDIAERVLATTESRSWELIGAEIRKSVPSARNTPSPNRGGRPRKALVQSNEPIGIIVERGLIAKCSDSQWRTVDQMELFARRTANFIRDVLEDMAARGLVEQRKAADNISIEYRIIDKRDAPLGVEALRRRIADLEFAELEKDERIADLERLLAEAHTENAGLRQRIARLEALSDADRDASQQVREPDETEAIEAKPETIH
jgi:hypothetical protein